MKKKSGCKMSMLHNNYCSFNRDETTLFVDLPYQFKGDRLLPSGPTVSPLNVAGIYVTGQNYSQVILFFN